MTCIVGIKDETSVVLIGDRGASDGDSIVSMSTPKIWKVSENMIAGYAGSGGLGQMIQFMDWPEYDGDDPIKWLRATLVPAIIETREKNAGKDEEEAALLIGININEPLLFEMDTSDYSIFSFPYTSIGSGGPIALGSLYTSEGDSKERGILAVLAAIEHSPSCKGPIDSIIC
jgi:20S proteasome alpha/beta subunit